MRMFDKWKVKHPDHSPDVDAPAAEQIPTSELRERALKAAEEVEAAEQARRDTVFIQTSEVANRCLQRVLGITAEWKRGGGGYSSSPNLVTEIDGFAIFYDSAMRTLYWGGKASKPTKSRTEIHDLASWGRLIK